MLSLNSSTFSGALGPDTINSSVPGAGQVNVASVSLNASADLIPLQAVEPFVLFTLRFDTLAVGISPLTFPGGAPFIISDGDGNAIAGSTGNGGSIEITGGDGGAIPESSTIVLMSAGLAVLLRKVRRRNV